MLANCSKKDRAEELRSRNRRHAANCRSRKRKALEDTEARNAELQRQVAVQKDALHAACEALEFLKMACSKEFGAEGEQLVKEHADFVEERMMRRSIKAAAESKRERELRDGCGKTHESAKPAARSHTGWAQTKKSVQPVEANKSVKVEPTVAALPINQGMLDVFIPEPPTCHAPLHVAGQSLSKEFYQPPACSIAQPRKKVASV